MKNYQALLHCRNRQQESIACAKLRNRVCGCLQRRRRMGARFFMLIALSVFQLKHYYKVKLESRKVCIACAKLRNSVFIQLRLSTRRMLKVILVSQLYDKWWLQTIRIANQRKTTALQCIYMITLINASNTKSIIEKKYICFIIINFGILVRFILITIRRRRTPLPPFLSFLHYHHFNTLWLLITLST